MESDRHIQPMTNPTHQFNQYVSQMQTVVGLSEKTVYQIFSEYLSLKNQNECLAQAIENITIPHSDLVTPEDFKHNVEALIRFLKLKEKNCQGLPRIEEHPWNGLGHPDHQVEETEALVRTIRFVHIALNKFWVEVQSFPIFLNTMSSASIQEMGHLFEWFEASPPWHERVQQHKVVPAMALPESRKQLLQFARDVKCIRALYEKLAEKQSSELLNPLDILTFFELVSKSVELSEKYELQNNLKSDVQIKLQTTQKRLERIQRVRNFLKELNSQTGLPAPNNLKETRLMFQALKSARKIPEFILPWRFTQALIPGQLIRIQAWKDRARPLLETRKKLDSYFRLDLNVDSEKLKEMATHLTSGGLLRHFKKEFRNAQTEFFRLIKPDNIANANKQTALQMAEKLHEWANYIEQKQAFETNVETQKLFQPIFKGIDTDFNSACETNQWSIQIRSEFSEDNSEYKHRVLDYLFTATKEQIDAAVLAGSEEEAREVENLLNESYFITNRDFSVIDDEENTKASDFNQLIQSVEKLGTYPDTPFSILNEIFQMTEEVLFLTKRIDDCSDLKHCMQSAYRGAQSDLEVIEQARGYIDAIQESTLPESLKMVFLTLKGVQRFGETRSFVSTAASTLASLQEHLRKLEGATFGQSTQLTQQPIPEVLTRIQKATKQPALLAEWVDYLRSEQNAKGFGVGPILEFFEENSLPVEQIETAYALALNASLLKKAMAHTQGLTSSEFTPIMNQ